MAQTPYNSDRIEEIGARHGERLYVAASQIAPFAIPILFRDIGIVKEARADRKRIALDSKRLGTLGKTIG